MQTSACAQDKPVQKFADLRSFLRSKRGKVTVRNRGGPVRLTVSLNGAWRGVMVLPSMSVKTEYGRHEDEEKRVSQLTGPRCWAADMLRSAA